MLQFVGAAILLQYKESFSSESGQICTTDFVHANLNSSRLLQAPWEQDLDQAQLPGLSSTS